MSDHFVVLGDYLREFMSEDDAALLLRFAQNMNAARHLMVFTPVRQDDEGNHICADCFARVHSTENESHRMKCSILAAWKALGDPRWFVNLERCEDEARSYDKDRTDRAERAADIEDHVAAMAYAIHGTERIPLQRDPSGIGWRVTGVAGGMEAWPAAISNPDSYNAPCTLKELSAVMEEQWPKMQAANAAMAAEKKDKLP